MSGRMIKDHSSWIGKGSDGMVMPAGAKMKHESSAGGAGELSKYEDTTEAIRSQQEQGQKKLKGHSQKPSYRN